MPKLQAIVSWNMDYRQITPLPKLIVKIEKNRTGKEKLLFLRIPRLSIPYIQTYKSQTYLDALLYTVINYSTLFL